MHERSGIERFELRILVGLLLFADVINLGADIGAMGAASSWWEFDWAQAIRGTFVPNISLTPEYLGALVAALGTTISPYLFFWQSAAQ